MKIRQKIAMLLAAAMTLTAVPAVTMATSDVKLTNGIVVAKEDTELAPGAQYLKIELKDGVASNTTTDTTFFITLAKADWKIPAGETVLKPGAGSEDARQLLTVGSYKKNSDSEVQVKLNAGTGDRAKKGDFIYIPLQVKLKGGDATVAIDGNGTVIDNLSPVIFAKTTDSKATVTFGDSKNINKSGKIADITIEEPLTGTFVVGKTITVSLRNTNYRFTTTGALELSKGFVAGDVTAAINSTNDQELILTIVKQSKTAPGRIKIAGAEISYDKSGKSIGDIIEVKVKDNNDNLAEAIGKVATSAEIGVEVFMKDKKVVDVVAGHSKKVTFSIKELVDDTMLEGRMIEVRLDKGFFQKNITSGQMSLASSELNGKMKVVDNTATFENFAWLYNNDADEDVIGFEFKVKETAGNTTLKKGDVNEIKFTDVEIFMPLDKTGDAKLSVEGRGVGSEASVVAINSIAPVTITAEPATLKVGLQAQAAGKLVIKETDKDRLEQGQYLDIWIDSDDSGITFKDKDSIKAALKVTAGDVEFDLDDLKLSTGKQKISLKVKRSSATAAVVEFTGLLFNVDRTVPQGNYDIKIGGPALNKDTNFGDLKAEKFIVIATPNTEDITANGLIKGVASFTIGASKYIMNGVEATMDGASYLNNGRTMVPVRYVASALGVNPSDIYFAKGTATIMAGSKTISLTVGNKTASLNGVPAKVMESAPLIKDGRTYVPVSEIGSLLGVSSVWDAATQTATFTNK